MDTLNHIYKLYDTVSKDLALACRRGCATCCTQNVTMTTLEGHRIVQLLDHKDQYALREIIPDATHPEGYRPQITTNEFALFCFKGEDPPEEANVYTGTACRFLSDNECTIYDARPFGCRCFFSTQSCEKEACAIMDPFLITVNTVFLQFIEHVDAEGLFGNLNDVLAFLTSTDPHKFSTNAIHWHGLAQNKPIHCLLIPPEHKERMKPILVCLKKIVF